MARVEIPIQRGKESFVRVAGRFALIVSVAVVLTCAIVSDRANPVRAGFQDWVAELRDEALSREISPRTVEAALGEVEFLPRVVELDRDQPEFTLTFDAYLERIVTDKRVSTGRDRLHEHRALLEQLRERYGVQPRFIVALWGIESDFGRRTGSFPVIDSLATLAYDGRRGAFFRRELLDALVILDEGHIDRASMLGSWSGAMGQPQFMPSSFRRFAVDHDGDARRDIWGSVPDVLASAANYLSGSGWRGDLIWGREVRLPVDLDPSLVGRDKRRPLAGWQALGVRCRDGSDLPSASVEGAIVRPDGDRGPAFLVYDNYAALLKWNRSDFFATTVGLLSDRIAGR